MSTVDSKVVEVRFDNKGFKEGVASTLAGLAELNKNLSKQVATGAIDALGKSVDAVSSRFSLMRVTAVGAMLAIGNQVAHAAINMAKSFTTGPIMDGFKNYETKINAIQTILANTGLEGKAGLGQVTDVLKQLNTYANQTVYNFSDMTKNIGTFTAAGVKLQPAADAIKGIANLAALSGSTADQASGAMYQLSQAIAAGKVGLQDWNSVVNAGIGGKVFQSALFETGKALGRIKGVSMNTTFDQWTKAGNTFRGSLKSGWINGKVLTQTLAGFTGDLTAAQLKSQGYNATQIKQIQKIGKVAVESATKIKTITQLAQALKEEVGTAYATVFETLVGNIDQAKGLLSPLHTFIENGLTKPIYALNTILQNWANIGGRIIFLDAIKQAFNDILRVISPVKKAFQHIFPTGNAVVGLYNLTIRIDNFFKLLKMGPHMADNVRRTFQGFFAILDIGKQTIKAVAHFIGDLFSSITKGEGGGGFLSITAHIGDFLVHLDATIKKGGGLKKFFDGIEKMLAGPIEFFHKITAAVAGFFDSGKSISAKGVTDKFAPIEKFAHALYDSWFKIPGVFKKVIDAIKPIGQAISNGLGKAKDSIGSFFGNIDFGHVSDVLGHVGSVIGTVFSHIPAIMSAAFNAVKKVADFIGTGLSKIPDVLHKLFDGLDYSQVLSTINTAIFGGFFLLFKKFVGRSKKEVGGSKGFLSTIKEPFEELTKTLKGMQETLKATVLVEIAIAIGILAASCVALAKINPGALTKALTAIAGMMGELFTALTVFGKIGGGPMLIATSAGLVIFAGAILLLTQSVKQLAKLSWAELAKGLVSVGALLLAVVGTSKLLETNSAGMITSGAALMIIAGAIRILVGAVVELGKQDLETLKKGLIGVGSLLAALALFSQLQSTDAGGFFAGSGLLLLALGINTLVKSVAKFGKMDTGVIKKGLITVGAILAGFAIFSQSVGNPAALLAAGASMLVVSLAMQQLGKALKVFGGFSWSEIGKGLTVMAGALATIALAIAFLPPTTLLSAAAIIGVAVALQLIGQAMKSFSGLSWEEIAKGMTVMAGSLLLIAAATIAMIPALPGAAAIVVVAGALKILAPVLIALSGLSWTELAIGLTALAGAFTVIGVAGLVLTPLVPTLLGLGASIALIGAGIALIGVGALAFAAGLTAIAAAGAGAAGAIIAIGGAVISLIPLLAAQLVKAIDVLIVALTKALPDFVKLVEKVALSLIDMFVKVAPKLVSAIVAMVVQMVNALKAHGPELAQKMTDALLGILKAIQGKAEALAGAGVGIIVNVLHGVNKQMPKLVGAGLELITSFIGGIGKNISQIVTTGTLVIIRFIDSLAANGVKIVQAGFSAIILFINGVANAIRDNTGELNKAGLNMASAIADGLTGGLASKVGSVFSHGFNLGAAALKGIRKAADIHSPSKEAFKLGQFVSDGFILGIRAGAPGIKAAFNDISTQFKQTMSDSAQDIANYRDKIKNANPKTKSGKAAIEKYTKALAEATKTHQAASTALDVLNTKFDKEHAHLLKLGKQYSIYATQLDNANKKLADAKSLRDSFTSGVVSQFGAGGTVNADTTVGSFNAAQEEKTADLKKFADTLKALRAAGIDDTTYQQLLSVGTDALPFMEELLQQGKPAIRKINGLDKQIAKQAANLSQTAYTALYNTQHQAMYNAGVASAQGIVDGLKKKEKSIADQMTKISKVIVTALKKALGIKSPSKVMATLGQFMAQGIVVGLDSSSKDIAASSANLGVTAANSLKKAISSVSDLALGSTNLTPTITPIVDLTEVKKSSAKLSDLLAAAPVSVDGAYLKAKYANATYQSNQAAASAAASNGQTTMPVAPFNYTQNNYSPKALSDIEIYRQTKNQISVAKGALVK